VTEALVNDEASTSSTSMYVVDVVTVSVTSDTMLLYSMAAI